jgi:hypothetical protein
MKKEWDFSPELGLFLLLIMISAVIAVGLIFYLLIKAQGMTITSWWRSIDRNRELGGVYNSLHLIGLAWDIIPVTQENHTKLERLGLKVINEGDHLHAQIL